MKKEYLNHIGIFIFLLFLMSCDNENDNSVITGTWKLVGYGSEESFKTCDYGRLSFYSDGTFTGVGYLNQLEGEYSCNGDKINLTYVKTKIGYLDKELYFFEDNLRKSERFCFPTKGRLRLFYGEKEFFEFLRD